MSRNNQTRTKARPPANALRVEAWRDLPFDRDPAQCQIKGSDGGTRTITLSKGNRIILDALIKQPVYCASPVRVSDRVCILSHEYGVQIANEMYENDTATDRAKFGVYFLGDGVTRLNDAGCQ